jgi:hypothetical protein
MQRATERALKSRGKWSGIVTLRIRACILTRARNCKQEQHERTPLNKRNAF